MSAPEGAAEQAVPESDVVELEPVSAAPQPTSHETTAADRGTVTESGGTVRTETGPREIYHALGLTVVSAGISLAVAPFVSWKAAEILAPLGNPLIPAGTLIVAGLVLFGVGVVRRALSSIRAEVAYIASEAPRLEQIASHGRELQREFSDVESSLGASRADVQTLRKLVEQLMQLATNPEFEVSLFRMAASLDQLGARLDVSMKDRFGSMDERLGGIQQTQLSSTEELTFELKSLDERLGERDSERLKAQCETRAQVEASAADLRERLDQGRAALEHIGTQTGRLEGAFSDDLRQQLEELREQLDHNLQTTVRDTGTQIEAISGAVLGLGGELAGALGQLESTLSGEAEQRMNDLREQLRGEAQAATERTVHSGQQLKTCLDALSGMDTSLERVQSVLTAGIAGLSEEAGRAARDVAEGLELLNNELNRAVDSQSASIASQVEDLGTQLSERADKQASELRDQETLWEACSQRQHQEFEGVLANHQAHLEQTVTQRCDALESELATLGQLIAERQLAAHTPMLAIDTPVVAEAPFIEFCAKVQAHSTGQVAPTPDAEPAAPFAAGLPFGHDVHRKNETAATTSGEPAIVGPLPVRDDAQPDQPKDGCKPYDYPIERLGAEFDDGWIDG